MSDTDRQNTERNIVNLRLVAITFSAMRSAERQGIDLEQLGAEQVRQISDQVWRQMNGIAFFYDDRMEANFAADGAAFSEDNLIMDDLSACSDFAQTAEDLQSALQ